MKEVRVASEPEALLKVLGKPGYRFKRTGSRAVVAMAVQRSCGLKVGMVGKVKFESRIKELVENLPDLALLVEPLLIVRRALREQIIILHRRLLAIVRSDEVCRRLMALRR